MYYYKTYKIDFATGLLEIKFDNVKYYPDKKYIVCITYCVIMIIGFFYTFTNTILFTRKTERTYSYVDAVYSG